MKNNIYFVLLFTFACNIISQIKGECLNEFDYSTACYCVDTTISADKNLDIINNQLIDRFLFSGLKFSTPLTNQFKDELTSLFNNSDTHLHDTVELTILYFVIVNRFLDNNPSGCALAAAVQSSISCIESGDNSGIIIHLLSDDQDTVINLIARLTKALLFGGKKALGSEVSEAELLEAFPPGGCNENGMDYDFDKIWDLKGSMYPSNVRDLAKQLYDSDVYEDKITALITTYSLLDLVHKIRDGYDPYILLELIYMVYSTAYPDCCTEEKLSRLNYLYEFIDDQRAGVFQNLTTFYSSNPAAC